MSYEPEGTGIVCGSGDSAFEIFDSGAFEERVIRFYDSNGNLTRRVIHFTEIGGEWSNPVTGATAPYTQNYVTTDVLAIPGDFTSATSTTPGGGHYPRRFGRPGVDRSWPAGVQFRG
ncbi:MAG: hypothetical protein ACJ74O_13330 [Frankiaceae bacterium]